MNGDYIKIMSDGSQCFVKDTEVFMSLYPEQPDVYVRPTLDMFTALIKRGMGDFLGQSEIEYQSHAECRKLPIGTIVWELEWSEVGEFYFIHTSQSKEIDRTGNEIVGNK